MLDRRAWVPLLGLLVACAPDSAERHAPDAQSVLAQAATDLVVGDERLFLFTNDALVSVPKAGGAPITIARRVESDLTPWRPLAVGGAYVVAAQDRHGPVVLVDQQTSRVVATWQPTEADVSITSVATDGDRVFVGLRDPASTSVVALPAPTLAGPPVVLARHSDVVVDRGGGARDADEFEVKQIVADGRSIYYARSEDHLTYACPTCGGVLDAPTRNVLLRLTGTDSTSLYEGSIERIALAADAIWVLERSVGGKGSVRRVPKDGRPVGQWDAGDVALLATSGAEAFVPDASFGAAYDGVRDVRSGGTTLLRERAVMNALGVDDDFVYASVVVRVDDCPSGSKGCLGQTHVVYSGIDRMPRAH